MGSVESTAKAEIYPSWWKVICSLNTLVNTWANMCRYGYIWWKVFYSLNTLVNTLANMCRYGYVSSATGVGPWAVGHLASLSSYDSAVLLLRGALLLCSGACIGASHGLLVCSPPVLQRMPPPVLLCWFTNYDSQQIFVTILPGKVSEEFNVCKDVQLQWVLRRAITRADYCSGRYHILILIYNPKM